MEVFVNKKFLKNMLFILFAVSLLVMKVRAQTSHTCNGKSYPLLLSAAEMLPDSDTTIHTNIRFNATTKVRLVKAEISYELYYPGGTGMAPIIEKIPFRNDSTARTAYPNTQFNIEHSHPWPLDPKPENFTLQITRLNRFGATQVLTCLVFPIDGP